MISIITRFIILVSKSSFVLFKGKAGKCFVIRPIPISWWQIITTVSPLSSVTWSVGFHRLHKLQYATSVSPVSFTVYFINPFIKQFSMNPVKYQGTLNVFLSIRNFQTLELSRKRSPLTIVLFIIRYSDLSLSLLTSFSLLLQIQRNLWFLFGN